MNNRYVAAQRPEAALQRAKDFIGVGREQDALNALYEVIKERRQKQWSETYEEIMMKYVELCVRLRNSSLAKDGLFQYRVFTQQVSPTSLKNVVEHFLKLAEARTEEAKKKSIERVEEIDDLDAADAPENLLMSVVSGADTQDRMDRTVLAPWLRFLWDSYRNCLDMLRNNTLVEEIYHQVARQSFDFCARYQRRNEFHKLCDTLRMHLAQIQKAQSSPNEYRHTDYRIKLTNVDSLALMQETRQVQLATAIQMELWQEAYKSAEDLHNIMQLSKDKDRRMVKPQTYVSYYDKLSLVFWKGGNILFHAAALLQKFTIFKDLKKTFSDNEAIDQATRVLLATLAIPHGGDTSTILTKLLDIEDQHQTNIRVLSSLLRLPIAPTRASLIKELALLNIPELAVEPVRKIYQLLEFEFSPLRLASKVKVELEKLVELGRPEYSQYIDELKSIVATKVLRQLTVIYDSLSLERFHKIIPFYSRIELEHFLVQTSKHRSVKARISHRDKCVRFNQLDLTLAGGIEAGLEIDAASNGIEYVREHLSSLHTQLHEAVYALDKTTYQREHEAQLHDAIQEYIRNKHANYNAILERRKLIERYKESNEIQRREKMQQMQKEQKEIEEKRRAEEQRRLEELNKENEKKALEAKKAEIEKIHKKTQIQRLAENPLYKDIIKERGEEELMEENLEQVIRDQREQMEAQRREAQNKLRQQEKNFDHMVRAYFLEEIQYYKKMSEEYHATAEERHTESERKRVERAIKDHERSIQAYADLSQITDEANDFLTRRFEVHKDDFEKRLADWERKCKVEKTRRLQDRKAKRKLERQQAAEREKREREEKEKEAAAQAEMERKEEERQKYREMHARLAEKQRERDDQERGGAWRPTRTMGQTGPRSAAAGGPPQEAPGPTRAEQSNNWRREAAPMPAPTRPIERRGPPSMTSSTDQQQRQPLRQTQTRAEEVNNWRSVPRAVPVSQPPAAQTQPEQQPPQADASQQKPGRYIPPHLRAKQQAS